MIMIMIFIMITITIKITIMIRIMLMIFINIVIMIVIDHDKKWIYLNWKTHFAHFTCGHHSQVFDHDHDHDHDHGHDHDHDHDHDYDHDNRCRLRRPNVFMDHCSFRNVFFSYAKLGLDVCPILMSFHISLNIASFHVILHTSHVNASARRYKIYPLSWHSRFLKHLTCDTVPHQPAHWIREDKTERFHLHDDN